jgi:hypothetical protein
LKRRPRAFFAPIAGGATRSQAAIVAAVVFRAMRREKRRRRGHAALTRPSSCDSFCRVELLSVFAPFGRANSGAVVARLS